MGFWNWLFGTDDTTGTAIAVALAARLTLDEARDFLHVAGYALSDRIPADIVYAACFRHRVYERAHVRALLGEFA